MPNNKVKEHLICSRDVCQVAGCTVRAETSTQVFLMFIWSTQVSPFYLEGKGKHFTCMHKNHHVYQQFSIPIDRIASDFKVSVDSFRALIWTSFVSLEGNHFLNLWSRNSVLSSEYWDLCLFFFSFSSQKCLPQSRQWGVVPFAGSLWPCKVAITVTILCRRQPS